MKLLITPLSGQAEPQAELFNVQTDIQRAFTVRLLVQLADRGPAVDSQMEMNLLLRFKIYESFVLMKVFAPQLPAPFPLDVWRFIRFLLFEKRSCILIKP